MGKEESTKKITTYHDCEMSCFLNSDASAIAKLLYTGWLPSGRIAAWAVCQDLQGDTEA